MTSGRIDAPVSGEADAHRVVESGVVLGTVSREVVSAYHRPVVVV